MVTCIVKTLLIPFDHAVDFEALQLQFFFSLQSGSQLLVTDMVQLITHLTIYQSKISISATAETEVLNITTNILSDCVGREDKILDSSILGRNYASYMCIWIIYISMRAT